MMIQVVVIYAANYVLVALSIDRYDAITHPLKFSGSCEFLILNNDKKASNDDLLLNKYIVFITLFLQGGELDFSSLRHGVFPSLSPFQLYFYSMNRVFLARLEVRNDPL
jgi:hypothetical protein